tara:strand:+ start:293 stop:775 length:483 start_codon:yes stop_codon:yes gene_type:complete
MQRNNQIGFLVEDTSSSQLSFNLIKNINTYLEDKSCDFTVFFENSSASVLNPNFALMSINEVWSFNGALIATNIDTARSLSKCFATKKKFFYVWDIEWTRERVKSVTPYEMTVQAFSDPDIKLIARSEDHARAIENYCNRKITDIVNDFNIEKLVRITNE